jgi:ABC-type proline/glycine betaine transport system ATPase subunit
VIVTHSMQQAARVSQRTAFFHLGKSGRIRRNFRDLHQPAREVIAALKIAGVIERIGDYAKNIAKRVGKIEGRAKIEPLTLIPAMAEIAQAWSTTC